MATPLRLLLAEDSEDDATLLIRALGVAGFDLEYQRVDSADTLLDALQRGGWDVIISDFNMGQFTGMDALRLVRERGHDVPFIFVSGTIGEDVAVAAMRAGAQDYVMKGNLTRLAPAVIRELREAEGRRRRHFAEEHLRATTELLHAVFRASPLAIIVADKDGRIQAWNPAAEQLFGWSEQEVLGTRNPTIPPAERDRAVELNPPAGAAAISGLDAKRLRNDGTLIDASVSIAVSRDDDGRVSRIITLVQDQRERKQLEAQFLRAQRMEAVGQLAGGIAHDFNNLLTVITSYCDFLLEDIPQGDRRRDEVVQIQSAAGAATSLSRQLLVFSSGRVLQPQVVSLNEIVTGTAKLLKRVLGAGIRLEVTLDEDAGLVEVDPGQLEQVIVNLALNARDAMPNGGTLGVETLRSDAERMTALVVHDTGVGMDPATQERVFEPFFTTKDAGKGTGLGLSTVYTIVTQFNGTVELRSEAGRGTAFTIRLPDAGDRPRTPQSTATVSKSLRGTATILVVENAAAVRAVARQVLERLGYAVLEAPDAATGLRVAERHSGTIHLLLTTVMMPGMNGRQLAKRLRGVRPDTRVLFTSAAADIEDNSGEAHLSKPFTPEALASAVRDALKRDV